MRHGAVSLAVGWYLMAPPMYKPDYTVNIGAPLARWVIMGSFDTAADCASALATAEHDIHREPGAMTTLIPGATATLIKTVKFRIKKSLCVASDDPRLAK
jgi:hypothetical protein